MNHLFKLITLFTFLLPFILLSQSEIKVISPYRKRGALLNFRVNCLKSKKDSIILERRTIGYHTEEEVEIIKPFEVYLDSLLDNQVPVLIYDRKGRLLEKCNWGHSEFQTGPYTRYWKNGRVRESGSYSDDGDFIGVWFYYNKRGELRFKILEGGAIVEKDQ